MTKRKISGDCCFNDDAFACGLTQQMVIAGLEYLYDTLDRLDDTLIRAESPRMAQLVELANLSSMLGNLLATGIVRNSGGIFERAGPLRSSSLMERKGRIEEKP